jgi:predicted nucleic acid-binding protein
MLAPSEKSLPHTSSPIGLNLSWPRTQEEGLAVPPALLDSSFLIDLEREIAAGQTGPAVSWLRRNRRLPERALVVSAVTVTEFLVGLDDQRRGIAFISRYVPQTIGFKHAKKCSELQRRAKKAGRRFGENDAWQLAVAECAGASVVARDRNAFSHLGERYERFA